MPDSPFTRLPVPAGPRGVAAVSRAAAAMIDGTGPAFAPYAEDDARAKAADRELPGGDVPDDLGLVVTTSGTTGAPLDVLISRSAVLASARIGARALGPPGHWLTAVPVTSIGGLLSVVRALLAGAEPIPWAGVGNAAPFTADAFAEAGREVLRRAASDGVPAYVSLLPTQMTRILRLPAATEVLAGFAGVLVGGAALAPGLRALSDKAGVPVVETYGATETCGGVVYDGVPLPGVEVRLEPRADLPDTTISIGGDPVASGYLGRPELTEATFVDGWFRSSDLGRDEGGRLRILGRSDGVVKIGGLKVPLEGVVEVLRRDPRVLDAAVSAHPDVEWDHRLAAHVVPVDFGLVGAPAARTVAAELADAVADAYGGAARPRTVEIVADLPTRAGKPIGIVGGRAR